jgi:hypothetical protein
MRKTMILSAFVVAVLAAPALFADDGDNGNNGVQWMHDYAEAKSNGEEAGKRVFIEFTAEW